MKRVPIATAILLMALMTVQISCIKDNNNNAVTPLDPEEKSECTIMWYGTGSGNVDPHILKDFSQFYKAKPESFDRVNIVLQYKASIGSTGFNLLSDNEFIQKIVRGATYRLAVDPTKTLRGQLMEAEPYGAMNCDFTCPDSLTNFINWAARTYPAKRYVLVMADHGGGYLPHDDVADAATKGMVFDDGHDKKCFSGKSFAKGVRNADVRPEGIVLYLCLMNNLEFLYDVKDVTDYIVCSTYTLWGTIGAMQSLPDNMAAGLDTRTALSNFVDANVDSWDAHFFDPQNPETPAYYDLTLTETKRLDNLAPVLREFTDRLVNTYQNGSADQRAAIDECTANAVKVVNQEPFYDMAKYMESLSLVLPDVFDYAFYNRFAEAFNSCIIHQRYARYLTNHNYQVDYSMMLAVKGTYVCYVYDDSDTNLEEVTAYYPDGTTTTSKYVPGEEGGDARYEFLKSGTWPGTFADTYQLTTFDSLVGWSRWLLLNETAPPAWSPCSFYFKLSGDMSEIPVL